MQRLTHPGCGTGSFALHLVVATSSMDGWVGLAHLHQRQGC